MVKARIKARLILCSSALVLPEMSNTILFLHRKFIDKDIVLTETMKNDCINNGITRIAKIHNGIDLNRFIYTDKKFNSTEEILNIITVSRFSYYIKGYDVMIKALKICKDTGMKL